MRRPIKVNDAIEFCCGSVSGENSIKVSRLIAFFFPSCLQSTFLVFFLRKQIEICEKFSLQATQTGTTDWDCFVRFHCILEKRSICIRHDYNENEKYLHPNGILSASHQPPLTSLLIFDVNKTSAECCLCLRRRSPKKNSKRPRISFR